MKRKLIPIILTSFLFVLSFSLNAQTKSPVATDETENPEDPNTGGDGGALGGGAPIAGGTLILMALGAAYGSKKVYNLYQDNQEELED